jgi:hypothetical protein
MNTVAAVNEWRLGPRRYRTRCSDCIATLHASNPGTKACVVNPAASIQSVQSASERSKLVMEIGLYPLRCSQSAKASM